MGVVFQDFFFPKRQVILEMCWFEKFAVPEKCILYRDCSFVFKYVLKKFLAEIRKDPGSPDIESLNLGEENLISVSF